MIGLPEILRDIVAQVLTREGNMCVVTSPREPGEIAELLDRHHPNVIVTTSTDDDKGLAAFDSVFQQNPSAKVFGISHDGRTVWRRELRFRTTRMENISPTELVAEIERGAKQSFAEREDREGLEGDA